jgi:hypothetical protein
VFLQQLDSLDYDNVEWVLDHVQVCSCTAVAEKQTTSAAFIAASALQRKFERAK